ncbi:MAG: hypothetical protein ACR2PZ_19650 [Pseudomonadales bacterium]
MSKSSRGRFLVLGNLREVLAGFEKGTASCVLLDNAFASVVLPEPALPVT